MALADVVKEIVAQYGDLHVLCRNAQVDPVEVKDALAKAKPDTAEHVVLAFLHKFHPVPPKPET